jgi:NAD+ synthase
VKALGADKVVAILMPEHDSNPVSEVLGRELAKQHGVAVFKEDLTGPLTALGCYEKRDAAVREVFPDYDPTTDGIKLVLPTDLLERGSLNVYSLALVSPGKEEQRRILSSAAYLEIVAASNMKQRTRMLMLYHHAERRNYAVVGTANKNEHAQGFFVKYGDGGADIQPIQHLFKTQVYQIARQMGVPQQVLDRTPTSDTYSAESTQEEFYFRLPFHLMDLIWYAFEHDVPAKTAADALELTGEQVERVYRDLGQKHRSTEYLRTPPVVLG